MALQALLPFIPTAISAIGSLTQGEQDPNEWIRNQMQQLIASLGKEYPRASSAARIREAVQRGGMTRQIQDTGAAGGLPRNVIQQQVTEASLGSRRNLDEYLENLRNQKINAMMGTGSLIASTPQQPVNTGWQDMFGLSLYDLLSSGKLQNLLQGVGQGQYAGFNNLSDYLKYLQSSNQMVVPSKLPMTGSLSDYNF